MKPISYWAFFDRRDHALIRIVNQALEGEGADNALQENLYPHFHPHGIKELAESRGLRVAYAMAHLVNSLEVGKMDERLSSLRSLFDEVQNIGMGPLPKNTARVLLQIMKDLVRARGDYARQLRLAHDFRVVAFGKPRVVRRHLKLHHLLEMPEEWNQLAFDDHVHDAYTKGRKSSTHLIMDAWIKGIRRLRVIYYNHVEPKVAAELLEAARIMGVDVRIGVEFSSLFRGRYVNLIWTPRGFPDSQAFLCFLAEDRVTAFMEEGWKVSRYQQAYVMEVFERFNAVHRLSINQELGVDLAPLDRRGFIRFVGEGQMSLLHLGTYAHRCLMPLMAARVEALRRDREGAEPEKADQISARVAAMNDLTPTAIVEKYLDPAANPELADPSRPPADGNAPPLLRLPPGEVIERLTALHTGHRVTLNLSGLSAEDVLEILYQCEGAVTRLEIFNLKDWVEGKAGPIGRISSLQQALNDGNVITLKRQIQQIIQKVRMSAPPDCEDRLEKLNEILHDIPSLVAWYATTTLKARMGSDSTGRQAQMYGMGLAVLETLPRRARKQVVRETGRGRMILPMNMTAWRRHTFVPRKDSPVCRESGQRLLRPGLVNRVFCQSKREDWEIDEKSIGMAEEGNIVTLGGLNPELGNGFELDPAPEPEPGGKVSFRYLNTPLKYFLKVLIGFIPAFLTFFLTKDWWLLAYFGAVIWFGATGLRNIIQSVLGGGGFNRSPLLKWNDFVSWERITDSLMWTGFSVPLLELVVKTLLCKNLLGITTSTNPVALFTILALVNGAYLASHNLLRGLPRGAVIGNLFRSVLSIPLAFALNAAAGALLGAAGVVGVAGILQKWAAIISKTASDTVAGIIEGAADRYQNLALRKRDYEDKLVQLMDIYAQLEILYPDDRVARLLETPGAFKTANAEARDLEKLLFVSALDMLYFWMYQPRARIALRAFMEGLSEEERMLVKGAQFFLEEKKEISRLFIDGMVGENFSRALSFYLDRTPEYLLAVRSLP